MFDILEPVIIKGKFITRSGIIQARISGDEWLVLLDEPYVYWPDGRVKDDFDVGYFDKEIVTTVRARTDQLRKKHD